MGLTSGRWAVVSVSVLVCLAVVPPAHADEAAATRVCHRAAPLINSQSNLAKTACAPGREASGYTLMIVTRETTLAGARRKPYLLAVVAAVGDAPAGADAQDVTALAIMDRQLGMQRQYLRMPVATVIQLSGDLRAERITPDQMYAAIEQGLKLVDLAKQ